MKYQKSIALIAGLLLGFASVCQEVYIIPKQTFNPYKVLGLSEDDYGIGDETKKEIQNSKLFIDSFEISRQVTFKQYRLYLESIKKDSSYNFYLSQLPDSGITSKENYTLYFNNKNYDDFSVAGIFMGSGNELL